MGSGSIEETLRDFANGLIEHDSYTWSSKVIGQDIIAILDGTLVLVSGSSKQKETQNHGGA